MNGQMLVIARADWEALERHFAVDSDERMAFAFCGAAETASSWQALVQAVDLPVESEYRQRGPAGVSLKAECVLPRAVRARGFGAFVDAHSHPFAEYPAPSSTDERGAREQALLLRRVAPGVRLIRLIWGGSGRVRAEVTSTDEFRWTPLTEIVVLGLEGRHVVRPVNAPPVADAAPDPRDLRTLAVLGADNTDLLRNLNVLIIGLGGVGSAVARLLAGYVGSLILVDPDTIESHNAPRLHYYAAGDEGTPKVAVARREILRAFPDRRVEAVAEPFPSEATIAALKDADFVFCCPDHNAVRYAVAREASRFLKPVVEAGCGGTRNDGRLTALGYHVRLQVPGGPCLACNGMDLRELEDPASTRMKRRISYLNDGGVVPGELMSLTTRAAADAVEVFLRYVTGYAGPPPRHLYFDALRLRALDATAAYQPQPECTLCGEDPDNLRGSGDALSEHQQIPAACGGVYAAV